jgi:ligand-binding sensor domain-containing protein/signal transduction histidine kinase
MRPRSSLKSLNSFRKRIVFCDSFCRLLLLVVCFFSLATSVWPQARPQIQYSLTRWGSDKGFPGGEVYAIAQTPDGLLWVGTEKGLVRFDGINFRLIQDKNNSTKQIGPVFGLKTDSEGDLLVRHQGPILMIYRNTDLLDISPKSSGPQVVYTAMNNANDGSVLISTIAHGTLRYDHGNFSVLATNSNLPNFIALSLAQSPDGNIWMGSRDAGLFFVKNGQIVPVAKQTHDLKINCLLAPGNQDLWMGTDNGVVRWNGKDFAKTGLPEALNHLQVLALMKDRESNIWVGTSKGLIRISPLGSLTQFQSKLKPHGSVKSLFEDREGNIWVGTTGGIERLRETSFKTYSPSELLQSEINGPIYTDDQERTWFAPATGGLFSFKDGETKEENREGWSDDVIYSIVGAKGSVWIGRQRGGLTHLYSQEGKNVSKTYTEIDGLAQNSVYSLNLNRDGTIWAGTLNGGVSRLKDAHFTTFTTNDGLLSNTVFSIYEAKSGVMWFGTPEGLNSFSDGRWKTYTTQQGLPANEVNCIGEDSQGVLWIGTDKGLATFRSDSISSLGQLSMSLLEPIYGIQKDLSGDLWISTASHVFRANPEKILRGDFTNKALREYDLSDGLPGMDEVKRDKSVVIDSRGQIWFSVNGAISFVDPARLKNDSIPALVHIEEIASDGKQIKLHSPIEIPANPQRVTFRYAAVSLSVPERIRYRYMLEGFDKEWSNPVTTREVTYTNLPSRSYRFLVTASNSEGTWNSAEANIQFKIDPEFWQTWWFRVVAILVAILIVLLFVRLRLIQLTSRMNMRFEERLAERTRIAQELHDTLLQGFLSASMQLHVADERLSPDSPAKPLVGRILQLMGRVIEEGRNAVKGLRYTRLDQQNLEEAFSHIQLEMSNVSSTEFRIIVEGSARPLKPILRDEVYLIGREALVNAFRHSQGDGVEVEIDYGNSSLRVIVRDNGRGIDDSVLKSGREGHWGLSGMRERAERIGAKLKVMSRADAGTEIELTVPARIAFESIAPKSKRWFSRLYLLGRVKESDVKDEQQL